MSLCKNFNKLCSHVVFQSSWFWVYTCGDVDDGSFLTRPLWCNTEYNLFQLLIETEDPLLRSRLKIRMETVLISYKAKVEGPRVSVHLLPKTVAGDIVERDAINVSETFGQAFIALTSDMCLFHPMLMLGKYREALHSSVHGNWNDYSQETGGKMVWTWKNPGTSLSRVNQRPTRELREIVSATILLNAPDSPMHGEDMSVERFNRHLPTTMRTTRKTQYPKRLLTVYEFII